jgi:homoserine dehydrogenase
MAGTPSIRLALEALSGCSITRVRGILNGTTNFILTQMQSGHSYIDALAAAQSLGYAEADPSADVDGWDAAGKLQILSNVLFGGFAETGGVEVSGITGITRENMQIAEENGERYKLIAEATPEGGRVQMMRLPLIDPLANVSGATNAVTFSTDLMGDVTLIGAGAGRKETGFAILSDLLAIHRDDR